MCTDLVFHGQCTIFWLKRRLRVHLDLYAPDFPKSTYKYTKVVREHESRCFTVMHRFWMQCFLKELFRAAKSFKLFQTHMLNIFY